MKLASPNLVCGLLAAIFALQAICVGFAGDCGHQDRTVAEVASFNVDNTRPLFYGIPKEQTRPLVASAKGLPDTPVRSGTCELQPADLYMLRHTPAQAGVERSSLIALGCMLTV